MDSRGRNNKLVLDHIDKKRKNNRKIRIVYKPGRLDPFYKSRYFDAIENDKRNG